MVAGKWARARSRQRQPLTHEHLRPSRQRSPGVCTFASLGGPCAERWRDQVRQCCDHIIIAARAGAAAAGGGHARCRPRLTLADERHGLDAGSSGVALSARPCAGTRPPRGGRLSSSIVGCPEPRDRDRWLPLLQCYKSNVARNSRGRARRRIERRKRLSSTRAPSAGAEMLNTDRHSNAEQGWYTWCHLWVGGSAASPQSSELAARSRAGKDRRAGHYPGVAFLVVSCS